MCVWVCVFVILWAVLPEIKAMMMMMMMMMYIDRPEARPGQSCNSRVLSVRATPYQLVEGDIWTKAATKLAERSEAT